MLPNCSSNLAVDQQWCLNCSVALSAPLSRCCVTCSRPERSGLAPPGPSLSQGWPQAPHTLSAPTAVPQGTAFSPTPCIRAWICNEDCLLAAHTTSCKLSWLCNRTHAQPDTHKPASCDLSWRCPSSCKDAAHAHPPSPKVWPVSGATHSHTVTQCCQKWQCTASCTNASHILDAWFCPNAHFEENTTPLVQETNARAFSATRQKSSTEIISTMWNTGTHQAGNPPASHNCNAFWHHCWLAEPQHPPRRTTLYRLGVRWHSLLA